MKKGGRFTLTRHTHTHVWIEFYNCIVCVWFCLKWNEWIPSRQMKKRERKRVRKESIDLLDCVRSFSQIVEHCIFVLLLKHTIWLSFEICTKNDSHRTYIQHNKGLFCFVQFFDWLNVLCIFYLWFVLCFD